MSCIRLASQYSYAEVSIYLKRCIQELHISRWFRLLPVVFITYSRRISTAQTSDFGTPAVMAKDLKHHAHHGFPFGILIFLGYFLFQIPGAHYASKQSAGA